MNENMVQNVAVMLDSMAQTDQRYKTMFDATGSSLSMFVAQQLESMEATVLKTVERELNYAMDIPVDTSDPEGSQTVAYRQMTSTGIAKFINGKSKDLPRVGAYTEKFYAEVHNIGLSFGWDYFELLNAQMAGVALQSDLAEAARRGINEKKNEIAYLGDSGLNILGLLNNSNVSSYVALAGGTSTSITWIGKLGSEIVSDLRTIKSLITVASKNTAKPDTLLIDPSTHDYLAFTQMDGRDEGVTILDHILSSRGMGITTIEAREECRTASALGNNRFVLYEKSPSVLKVKEPLSMRMLPVQYDGLEYNVPVVARVAGVVMYRPMSVAYIDEA